MKNIQICAKEIVLSVFLGGGNTSLTHLMDEMASVHTVGSVQTPRHTPPLSPWPPTRQPPSHFIVWVSTGAQEPQEPPAEAALASVRKLPQLSGHVESYSFAFHEKLKSCPDLMGGNG